MDLYQTIIIGFFHGEQYVRPFYPNINLNAPSSSYRVVNIVNEPHISASSGPVSFDNTDEENVSFEDNFENDNCNFDEEHLSTNPINDDLKSPNSSTKSLYKMIKSLENEIGDGSKSFEPTGPRADTTKDIAGSKSYSGHGPSLRECHVRDPTSWELYVHSHRHDDGSFVEERSRLVPQAMGTYMDKSLTPLEDETIPDHPSLEEVNNIFKPVINGPKKRRMYGCGSMAATIYPYDMAPCRCERSSSSSRASQQTAKTREELEKQKRSIELIRTDLQAIQRENSSLKNRMTFLEDQVRILIAGLSQGTPVQPQAQTSSQILFERGAASRDSSTAGASHGCPFAAGPSSSRHSPSQVYKYSHQYVGPSQDFGYDNDADADEDENNDAYADDETQAP